MLDERQREFVNFVCERMFARQAKGDPSAAERILHYICEHSYPRNEEALSVQAIAMAIYVDQYLSLKEKESAAESYLDGTRLRQDLMKIRQRLKAFRATFEGRKQLLNLEIPDEKRYALIEADNIWVKHFWQPNLGLVGMTEIIYAEPRFYRSRSKHLFVRFLNVNERTSSERALRLAPMIAEDRLHSCRHYVSAGEITAILRLTKMLEWYGVTTKHEVSHKIDDWADWQERNLILIGNSRTHWAIRDLQSDRRLDFKIFKDRIKNLNPQPGESRYYKDFAWIPGRYKRQKIYVLVTRLQNPQTGQSILLLCSNHGRAHEKVGELLTTDEALQELAEQMGIEQWQPFPAEFQILLSVEIDEEEQAVSPAAYVTHRPLPVQVGGTRKQKTKS